MTPAERVRRYLDTIGQPIPTTDAEERRHLQRPPFTPVPEPLAPLLRDVLAELERRDV